MSSCGSPVSGIQYARLSPTQPTTRRVASTTAATKVHEAGLPGGGRTGDGARHDGVVGRVRGRLECLRGGGDPRCGGPDPARGRERGRTSRAARAAARLAMSESTEFDTPSQTTRTAWLPGSARASSATASSLRWWRTPRSHTAGHPARRLLGEVVARAAGLRPALGAVAVVGDHATALVAGRRARPFGQGAAVLVGRRVAARLRVTGSAAAGGSSSAPHASQ